MRIQLTSNFGDLPIVGTSWCLVESPFLDILDGGGYPVYIYIHVYIFIMSTCTYIYIYVHKMYAYPCIYAYIYYIYIKTYMFWRVLIDVTGWSNHGIQNPYTGWRCNGFTRTTGPQRGDVLIQSLSYVVITIIITVSLFKCLYTYVHTHTRIYIYTYVYMFMYIYNIHIAQTALSASPRFHP